MFYQTVSHCDYSYFFSISYPFFIYSFLFPGEISDDGQYCVANVQKHGWIEATEVIKINGYAIDDYPEDPVFDDTAGQHPGGYDADGGGEGVAHRDGGVCEVMEYVI